MGWGGRFKREGTYVYLWLSHVDVWQKPGLPWWLRWSRIHLQCRRPRFPGSGRSPWRGEWQPTPVFLPGEFHGQRSLADYSPWGCKESDTTEQLIHRHTEQKPAQYRKAIILQLKTRKHQDSMAGLTQAGVHSLNHVYTPIGHALDNS